MFGDLLGGIFNQQDAPEFKSVSPGDFMGSIGAHTPQAAAINNNWNRLRLGDVATPGSYLSNMEALQKWYDPNQSKLRQATSKSILDELNLGGSLDPDTVAMMQQHSRETGAAVGPGGFTRNLVPRDLGLTAEQVKSDRQKMASGFTLGSAKPWEMGFQEQQVANPADAANLMLANVNAENQYNTFGSQLKASNSRNAASGLGGILGSIGGLFGGGGGGGGFGSILKTNTGGGGGGGWLESLGGLAGTAGAMSFGMPMLAPIASRVGSMAGGQMQGLFG